MALEARISQLLALDENRKCVDCGTRSPRWASYSLGVFMCLQCAGFHRALGVHISRVKSCDLDRWTEDQVRAMEAVGNARGREEYGPSYAEVNNTTYLPDAASLETFIRSKYVRRLYAKGGFGASFNTPEAAAAAAARTGGGAARKLQLQQGSDDLWDEYREPQIDTTSKIRIDWPRKPAATTAAAAAAAATAEKTQKYPSLIDLFEPTPVAVVRQQQTIAAAAAPFDPFFADFSAAPTAAAASAAPAAADDPFGCVAAAVAAPKQLQPQQSCGGFLLQTQPQPPLSFDDDFGDFVVAAAAGGKKQQQPGCMQTLQPVQPGVDSLLFGDDSENVPPPLPPKDYDRFESLTQPVRSNNAPATASRAPGASSVDALAGLFGPATALAPTSGASVAAPATSRADAAATPRLSTADIMSLYGARSGGAGPQSPAMPPFVANFGGPGASWA